MATAKIKEELPAIVLELSSLEAAALQAILGAYIAGDQTGIRKHIDGVHDALFDLGFKQFNGPMWMSSTAEKLWCKSDTLEEFEQVVRARLLGNTEESSDE